MSFGNVQDIKFQSEFQVTWLGPYTSYYSLLDYIVIYIRYHCYATIQTTVFVGLNNKLYLFNSFNFRSENRRRSEPMHRNFNDFINRIFGYGSTNTHL